MFESLRSGLHDAMMADYRRRYGLDNKSDEELQGFAIMLLQILPTARLKALVERQASSERLTERKKAQQLAVVLFAQDQLRRGDIDLTPAETATLLREMMEDIEAKPRKPL